MSESLMEHDLSVYDRLNFPSCVHYIIPRTKKKGSISCTIKSNILFYRCYSFTNVYINLFLAGMLCFNYFQWPIRWKLIVLIYFYYVEEFLGIPNCQDSNSTFRK